MFFYFYCIFKDNISRLSEKKLGRAKGTEGFD